MRQIRFQFDAEKLANALAYFSSRGVKDLDKLKAAKLLYFADKFHLLHYGRPVIGDQYACMDHGPVPSVSLNVMNDLISGEVSIARDIFDRLIAVEPGSYPTFVAKREPDLDVFSPSDIAALDHAVENYGAFSSWQVRNMSHDEPAWKAANQRRPAGSSVLMDYREFFGDDEESAKMLAQVEAEQEDREFADSLRR